MHFMRGFNILFGWCRELLCVPCRLLLRDIGSLGCDRSLRRWYLLRFFVNCLLNLFDGQVFWCDGLVLY